MVAWGGCAVASPEDAALHYYAPAASAPGRTIEADVCVYGGTPGGVMAAVQAARMGKRTVLAVFGRHVGGMTSGGLTKTDGGHAIGGLATNFYARLGRLSGFNPDDAEKTFRAMLDEAGVRLFEEQHLVGVAREGNRIASMATEDGATFRARVFIDASYEGDLMAAAGVTFHVGREANAVYGETINGIREPPVAHQFKFPIDPYRVPGDPASGLLPGISAEPPGTIGVGDRHVQAYNFRMQLAAVTNGGLPFPKPAAYDPGRYELLLRYVLAGAKPGDVMQAHAGDSNNQGGFSTDNIGMADAWPEGDAPRAPGALRDAAWFLQLYATRERLYRDHVAYQQGMFYFLTHDDRVPAEIRAAVGAWGLSPHCFAATGHWPHELYVREGRRMVGELVMTEHQCVGSNVVADPVGLAEYTMDAHNARRLVIDGAARNEGDVEVRIPGPYPVAYRAFVPRAAECDNLLVPVCLSASHIAYGSIRMEPTFMVLGQSAGTAAVLACDAGCAVQAVDYPALRARLLADGQMLVPRPALRWPLAGGGPIRSYIPLQSPSLS